MKPNRQLVLATLFLLMLAAIIGFYWVREHPVTKQHTQVQLSQPVTPKGDVPIKKEKVAPLQAKPKSSAHLKTTKRTTRQSEPLVIKKLQSSKENLATLVSKDTAAVTNKNVPIVTNKPAIKKDSIAVTVKDTPMVSNIPPIKKDTLIVLSVKKDSVVHTPPKAQVVAAQRETPILTADQEKVYDQVLAMLKEKLSVKQKTEIPSESKPVLVAANIPPINKSSLAKPGLASSPPGRHGVSFSFGQAQTMAQSKLTGMLGDVGYQYRINEKVKVLMSVGLAPLRSPGQKITLVSTDIGCQYLFAGKARFSPLISLSLGVLNATSTTKSVQTGAITLGTGMEVKVTKAIRVQSVISYKQVLGNVTQSVNSDREGILSLKAGVVLNWGGEKEPSKESGEKLLADRVLK